MAEAAENMSLTDTVNYKGLRPGREYVLKGILMDKATGDPLLINGEQVTQELRFTPDDTDGSVDMTFTFEGSALAGKTVVAFESCLYDGKEIAVHHDIDSEEQTVHIPEIETKLTNDKTGTHEALAEKEMSLTDTVPYHNLIPKNTREWLGIDTIRKNGIFKIEPMNGLAMYDRCYIFEDVNYINKDIDKKKSALLELIKLFKCMDSQFKITVASEQHDMKSFFNEVFAPVNGEEYPLLEKGIGTWINQKIEEGTRDIKKLLLLTVTHRAKSFEEAETFFGTLDTTLTTIFCKRFFTV